MQSSKKSHFLLVTCPGWSHARGMCVLAARIVSENPDTTVTILTISDLLEKTRFEVDRQLEQGSPIIERIRVLSVLPKVPGNFVQIMGHFAEAYAAAYDTLVKEEPITCAETGTTFGAAPAPSVLIIDFFNLPHLKASRKLTGYSVPIIAWLPCSASLFIHVWGPERLGGYGDFGAKVDAEAALTGRPSADIAEEFYRPPLDTSTVFRVPGLPPMYHHEFQPQKINLALPITFLIDTREFVLSSDGFVIASSDAYEKESLDALRGWFAELRKPSYTIGPILPTSEKTRSDVNKNSLVEAFLDSMLRSHGKCSVFFISFGTIFWPSENPDYLEEVIDALLENKIPFIFSHASPFAKIPAQLSERVNSSALGFLTSWAPQQFILNHPATGWFLSHGGHGSVMESLSCGIPLIFWPFEADQPTGAAHVTENLKAGIELFEVRSGRGLGPIYRNGKTPKGTREAVGEEIRRVLDICKGKEGDQMRRNAERLKVEFRNVWEKGGSAILEVQKFLKDYA